MLRVVTAPKKWAVALRDWAVRQAGRGPEESSMALRRWEKERDGRVRSPAAVRTAARLGVDRAPGYADFPTL